MDLSALFVVIAVAACICSGVFAVSAHLSRREVERSADSAPNQKDRSK